MMAFILWSFILSFSVIFGCVVAGCVEESIKREERRYEEKQREELLRLEREHLYNIDMDIICADSYVQIQSLNHEKYETIRNIVSRGEYPGQSNLVFYSHYDRLVEMENRQSDPIYIKGEMVNWKKEGF